MLLPNEETSSEAKEYYCYSVHNHHFVCLKDSGGPYNMCEVLYRFCLLQSTVANAVEMCGRTPPLHAVFLRS